MLFPNLHLFWRKSLLIKSNPRAWGICYYAATESFLWQCFFLLSVHRKNVVNLKRVCHCLRWLGKYNDLWLWWLRMVSNDIWGSCDSDRRGIWMYRSHLKWYWLENETKKALSMATTVKISWLEWFKGTLFVTFGLLQQVCHYQQLVNHWHLVLHNLTCLLKSLLSAQIRTWHLKHSIHLQIGHVCCSWLWPFLFASIFLTMSMNPSFWPTQYNCCSALGWWRTRSAVELTWPYEPHKTDSNSNGLNMCGNIGQAAHTGLFIG